MRTAGADRCTVVSGQMIFFVEGNIRGWNTIRHEILHELHDEMDSNVYVTDTSSPIPGLLNVGFIQDSHEVIYDNDVNPTENEGKSTNGKVNGIEEIEAEAESKKIDRSMMILIGFSPVVAILLLLGYGSYWHRKRQELLVEINASHADSDEITLYKDDPHWYENQNSQNLNNFSTDRGIPMSVEAETDFYENNDIYNNQSRRSKAADSAIVERENDYYKNSNVYKKHIQRIEETDSKILSREIKFKRNSSHETGSKSRYSNIYHKHNSSSEPSSEPMRSLPTSDLIVDIFHKDHEDIIFYDDSDSEATVLYEEYVDATI